MSACIRGPRGVQGSSPTTSPLQKQPTNAKSIIQIYMDWGNHYLEKARSKKLIGDLQADFVDGLLLAELIEAVTNQKVPDVNKKPKTPAQMVENIKACLVVLERLGVSLEGVTVKEVREGSLKAVLALFFALSKYKQQTKQRPLYIEPTKHQADPSSTMIQSRLPTPYHNHLSPGIQTAIPTPLPHRTSQPQGVPLKCPSASSSRSTSPSHSFIPTPRSSRASQPTAPAAEKQQTGSRVTVRAGNGISAQYNGSPQNKNSMLDKLKLFNSKDKTKSSSTKRTPSTISNSVRSEHSNSSNSVHNDVNVAPKSNHSNHKDGDEVNVVRRKGARAESRLARPGSRPSSGGKTPVQSNGSLPTSPPNPHSTDMDVMMVEVGYPGDPLRGGVGGSGIPKPTAVVKSYSKPTNPVNPMPRPPSPQKIIVDIPAQETCEKKQVSVGEEDDESGESVKPMEPMFNYKSRTCSNPPTRTIPQDRTRSYRPLGTYPVRSSTETNFADADYSNLSVSSGYLSDSDVRPQTKSCDISDGYMSESGTGAHYQRIHDQRGIPSVVSNFGKFDHHSYNTNHKTPGHLREGARVTDEQVDLSSTVHHTKVRVVNGGSGGGRGTEQSNGSSPAPPHAYVYRVVSSRHVKKSESSQQTDPRHAPQNQWKVTNVNGKAPDSERSREKRNSPAPSTNGSAKKIDKTKHRIPASGSREELDSEFLNGDKAAKNGQMANGACKSNSKARPNGNAAAAAPQSYGYVKRPSAATPPPCAPSPNNQSPKDLNQQPKVAPATTPRAKVKAASAPPENYPSRGPALGSVTKMGPAPSGGIGSNITASGRILDVPDFDAWPRHPAHSLPTRTSASGRVMDGVADTFSAATALLDAESIESLPAQLQHRASLTHARILGAASTAPRLSRSNSIRSTKSEKVYPSMLQRSEESEPYYSIPYSMGVGHSQPTSPTPSQMSQGALNRFNYPISPISGSPSSHTMGRNTQYVTKMSSKDDDVHGSAVSLVSTASSLYSTAEEKQAHEVRKLRKELGEAQEKVQTLTHQLSTNAHVVSAFEQSLSNMTQRLQQLTATAEKKDCELMELRQTIDALRRQGAEVGLTVPAGPDAEQPISRQLSTDSVSSLNSLSSTCSLAAIGHLNDQADKKKKRGWLRSSFNKAFSRSKKNKTSSSSVSADGEDARGNASDLSAPPSPLLGHHPPCSDASPTTHTPPQSGTLERDCSTGSDLVDDLKRQLREKDLVLTDIRLEALSSAHQLESLKDTVIKMRNEMYNLKQDNERLQRLVTSKSLTSSSTSLPRNDSLERRFSMNDAAILSGDVKYDLFSGDPDGKRVTVSIVTNGRIEDAAQGVPIAIVSISGKTKWDMLDAIIRRVFKDYLERVDPSGSLGLSSDSLENYQIGEVKRERDSRPPELLPCGYLVGDTSSIAVSLRGPSHNCVDALAFDTLIPKSIIQRYISLLTEYRRIILCGPSGTGKTFLANKLAEFLAARAGKESMAEAVATFNVECKSSKELRQYLTNVAEQCETAASDLPSVIILDNLHQAASLQDVFQGFLSAKTQACPYIIGTMNQATTSTTNLQLHHNFRWILCANHMEPVKGFLGRYLRRRLIETEVTNASRVSELCRVVDWLPRVWIHLNNFLETHSSSDVTIGPRLLLSCPMDGSNAQVWFTDLWNYSIVPYLLEAVREGLQLYGRRAPWHDPTQYLIQTYPWHDSAATNSLIRLRPEDVGYDPQPSSILSNSSVKSQGDDGDPLMNMLMRLQEAANYSGPQNSDSPSNTNSEIDSTVVDPL